MSLEDNLELLARWQPQVAIYLANASPSRSKALSSPEEAQQWFSSLDLTNKDLLYVYGVGEGHYYQAAKKWLRGNSKRVLVFLEDNLGALRRLLSSTLGSQIMHDPQVRIHAFSDPTAEDVFFSSLSWDFALKRIHISALRTYTKKYAATYQALSERLTFEHHRKNEVAQEYLDQGIVFFQNFYPNVLQMSNCYVGDNLFNKFKGVPAIICGAGPSLAKQMPLLETLRDKALIFAGGSALNALSAHGVQPHFACAIDPNFSQYQRLIKQGACEVPFFLRSRLHHRAFNAIHGPRLYLTGTGGYEVASFFESRMGKETSGLDEGHNVVNFATSIAQALGCNPLIFVGLDLAYTDMRSYAEGIVDNSSVTLQDIKHNSLDAGAVLRRDIYGKPIYTLWKWIDEAQWLTDFAKSHPKTTVINATEGGLGIHDVPNEPFATAIKRHCKRSFDLEGWVWGEIQRARFPRDAKKRIEQAYKELRVSLVRCQKHTKNLLQLLHKQNTSSGRGAVEEALLEQEPAYHAILAIFNAFKERIEAHDTQQLILQSKSLPPQIYKKKMHALEKSRYEYLQKVAKTHIALIDYAREFHIKIPTYRALPKTTSRGLIVSTSTRNGLLHGLARVLDNHKRVLSECRFVKGLREGECLRYYADGALYAHEHYHKGKLSGLQHYYYPDGTLKTEIDSSKGIGRLYTPQGRLKRTVTFASLELQLFQLN